MESEASRGRQIEPPFKYPANCIGWILFYSQNSEESKVLQTGFLISDSLVVTATNGFFIQQENSLETLTPRSFCLFQGDNFKREYKIQSFRLNPMYVSLQREFTETWRVMQQAKEEAEIARLREKATKIKLEQIRHDFALLKLEQSVKRPKYLQLEPYIPPNATLLLSGYCNSPPLNFYQWIYSSKPAEICDPAIYYDMDTKAGQGGSPVYLEGQDCRVVGMHKGLHFGKKLRFATLITPPIIATIKQWSNQLTARKGHSQESSSDEDDQIYENQNMLRGYDRRRQVIAPELNSFPYNCIGWLVGKNPENNNVIGTAFLISGNLALTSAHTIREIIQNDHFGNEIPLTFTTENEKAIRIVNFRVNKQYIHYEDDVLSHIAMREMYETSQERRAIREQIKVLRRKQRAHDFALLLLEDEVKRPNYFQLFPKYNPQLESTVTVAGYINCFGQRFDHLTHSGPVGPVGEGGIHYDVDTSGGQSGAPVFLQNSHRLVGVHKGYTIQDKLNFGTLITQEVVKMLYEWALEMKPFFTVAN